MIYILAEIKKDIFTEYLYRNDRLSLKSQLAFISIISLKENYISYVVLFKDKATHRNSVKHLKKFQRQAYINL